MENILQVQKHTLLLIAGVLWLAGGINILRIGITTLSQCLGITQGWLSYFLILRAIVVFIGFSFMFYRIVNKHCNRILSYSEKKKSIFYCFDFKNYLLMIFMIGLGIGLRLVNSLPDIFFATFYSGLGSALTMAGFQFILNWRTSKRQISKEKEISFHIQKIIWLLVGLIALGAGTVGIVLPILPTVPLYLLATFGFANSSARLHNWFLNSRLYKQYLLPYKEAGGLPLKAKIPLVTGVTIQIMIAAYIVQNHIVGLIVIMLLYMGFLFSMLFIVKTIPSASKKKTHRIQPTK